MNDGEIFKICFRAEFFKGNFENSFGVFFEKDFFAFFFSKKSKIWEIFFQRFLVKVEPTKRRLNKRVKKKLCFEMKCIFFFKKKKKKTFFFVNLKENGCFQKRE